jgi:hypothetical protein
MLQGLTLVPGGGVEPPRAEARRILSSLLTENKGLTAFAVWAQCFAISCYVVRAYTEFRRK